MTSSHRHRKCHPARHPLFTINIPLTASIHPLMCQAQQRPQRELFQTPSIPLIYRRTFDNPGMHHTWESDDCRVWAIWILRLVPTSSKLFYDLTCRAMVGIATWLLGGPERFLRSLRAVDRSICRNISWELGIYSSICLELVFPHPLQDTALAGCGHVISLGDPFIEGY